MNNEAIAFTTKYNRIVRKLITHAIITSKNDELPTNLAQWDTGATSTCIAQSVVDRLDLKPVSQTLMQTPSGSRVMDVYLVDITLPNKLTVKDVLVIGSEIGSQGIDLLIGMDIISLGDFSISNFEGRTQISFRYPSQMHADFIGNT